MELNLKNRVALVTGASRGIGRAIAHSMASSGAQVCLVSREMPTLVAAADEIAQSTGAQVLPIAGDVSDVETPQRIVAEVEGQWGRVDILVNVSGGPPPGSFLERSEDEWSSALAVSLMSVVRFTRSVVPGMKERGWGRLLTVSSTIAKEPTPQMVLSATARAGVSAFTKAIATELAPHGITANVLLPGGVATQRLESLVSSAAERDGITYEESLARSVALIPLGRFATPEEFANVALFLSSPEGGYITGVSLEVDGGLTRSLF